MLQSLLECDMILFEVNPALIKSAGFTSAFTHRVIF